jgi:hypothetical protein
MQLPVPPLQAPVQIPAPAVRPSAAAQSSSRSTWDTFANVDDDDGDDENEGRRMSWPHVTMSLDRPSCRMLPRLSRHSSPHIDGAHMTPTL